MIDSSDVRPHLIAQPPGAILEALPGPQEVFTAVPLTIPASRRRYGTPLRSEPARTGTRAVRLSPWRPRQQTAP